jgi:hypothetical protein
MMPKTFAELYSSLLKAVFIEQAKQQLEQGNDSLTCAHGYAEQGKPDFVLAYLLLADVADDVKCDLLAHSYERRAVLSEEKAASFDRQFHRPFPLITLEAQKDRMAARQIRSGQSIHRETKTLRVN